MAGGGGARPPVVAGALFTGTARSYAAANIDLVALMDAAFEATEVRPDWALDLGIRLALLRDDTDLAEEMLGELIRQGSESPLVRLELAIEFALSLYKKSAFPLGLFASATQTTIPQFMHAVVGSYPMAGPLCVEWADENRLEARQALMSAKGIILTRSALWSLQLLGAAVILDGHELHASRSLVRELQKEIKALQTKLSAGELTVHEATTGIAATKIEPDDPGVQDRLCFLTAVVQNLQSRGHIHPRPLSMVGSNSGKAPWLCENIGAESFDALALAIHLNLPLYCDDFGLRRLPIDGKSATGFSTATVLEDLYSRQLLPREQVFQWIAVLARHNYTTIIPTLGMLDWASRAMSGEGQPQRDAVLRLLTRMQFSNAVAAAAKVVEIRVRERIRLVATEDLVRALLAVLAEQWPAAECCRHLPLAVDREIPLFPEDCIAVRLVCEKFRRDTLHRI